MKLKKKFIDYLSFLLFGIRTFSRNKAKEIALMAKPGNVVLEIGSGTPDKFGNYYFSMKKYFSNDVKFILSDIKSSSNAKNIDILNFSEKEQYDHILCFSVLDDIYDWQRAFLNLYDAVKLGGYLHVLVPVISGLDLKGDCYRFTEHVIRYFCGINNIKIDSFDRKGSEVFPFAMYFRIKK